MNRITFHGEFSPKQTEAAQAANNLYEEVCNQNTFSKDDCKRILNEVKRVHKLCKESFNGVMFTWQVDRYQLQMYLENKNEFVFANEATMTWTKSRWESALIHELAIHFYREHTMAIYDFQLKLMCCWLLFQYFNTTVFKGIHCKQVFEMSFQIVQERDEQIEEAKREIKQWRKDNDALIKSINYSKSAWRREIAKCKRLVYGWMKPAEVELHHMVGVAFPRRSYEDNIIPIARSLGLSIQTFKKRGEELGFNAYTFRGHMLYYDEYKAEYDKEYKWAEKVLSNSLSKKEKKEFWRKHRIYNSHTPFRTFTPKAFDLTPAPNPLETSDDQPRENYNQDSFFGMDVPVENVFRPVLPPVCPPINPFMAHRLFM